MRPKESIALKNLPDPRLRIFGPTSGVTAIYDNGAVIVEDSTSYGHLASAKETAMRLGTPEKTPQVPSFYQLERRPLRQVLAERDQKTSTIVAEEVGRQLDLIQKPISTEDAAKPAVNGQKNILQKVLERAQRLAITAATIS